MWQRLIRCVTVPSARLGWILIVIGLPAWFLFGRHADWNSLRFYFSTTRQADGVVLSSKDTGFTIGNDFQGHRIHGVRFSFADSTGCLRQATSWTELPVLPRGAMVQVEYVESAPDLARIRSYRSGPLPLWAAATILFPLFGIACILSA